MKKLFYILCIALMVASCGVSNKAGKDKVVVGVCHNGTSETTKGYFRKCIEDAGGVCVIFPEYTLTDAQAQEYVKGVDAVIIPGSNANDTTGRKNYDAKVIKATLDAGKPILGICFGHQRIAKDNGGKMAKVAAACPGTSIKHKDKDSTGFNVGLNSQAHPMIVDRDSKLFKLLGKQDTVMVNTSHIWCVTEVPAGFKVVGRAPDGCIEAYEAERIMGVQFHPEFLYGKMGIKQFLPIFENLVNEAAQVKKSNKK
ncbi:MAG: gamma-glutamyl-gamma-aminobutyrate hydrolase family protein [Bacteroidales bacterium]|nr:gamma-glutamyl-gamma-aminobutyrate hydrolase family protein [Bacteroidales bacterium]